MPTYSKQIVTKHVVSMDFDGCFGPETWDPFKSPLSAQLKSLDRLMHKNEFLISAIRGSFQASSQRIVLVGSNRQWFDIDWESAQSKGNGSAFPAIEALAKVLGASFDPLLLSDICLDKEAGYTFNTVSEFVDKLKLSHPDRFLDTHLIYDQLLERHWYREAHGSCLKDEKIEELKCFNSKLFFDDEKINLLYAQMHKMAMESRHEDVILFDFFDDRADILRALAEFFNLYQELVPNTIILRLFQYVGGEACFRLDQSNPSEDGVFAEIRGRGVADSSYAQTVKDMSSIAKSRFGDFFKMSECITPTKLLEFRHSSGQAQIESDVAQAMPLSPLPTNISGSKFLQRRKSRLLSSETVASEEATATSTVFNLSSI